VLDFTAIRALTFDCYGTLIDWERGLLDAIGPVRRRASGAWSDTQIIKAYGRHEMELERGPYVPYRRVVKTIGRRLGEVMDAPMSEAEAATFGDSVGEWPAFAETPAVLAALKRRFRLYVISNVDDDLFARTAPKLDVPIDGLISAQQCGSYKPSLNNFRVALGRIGLASEQVLHVAASLYHDIEPATELGLKTVWVDRSARMPGHQGESGRRASLIVRDLGSLVHATGA